MAIDGYMFFKDYAGNFLPSESQVEHKPGAVQDPMFDKFLFGDALKKGGLFEVDDYNFDVEQTLNIGSQSSGAGAGKITFNPFSITRKIDKSSPRLFTMCCAGTTFTDVRLGLRKSAGADQSGIINLVFCFKLVAVKTIAWAHGDEAPTETTTFEYGGLQMFYMTQKPSGALDLEFPGGWNRVKNIRDDTANSTAIT